MDPAVEGESGSGVVDPRALQSASALFPPLPCKWRRVSPAPPGDDSPSGWLQSLASALQSAMRPIPGEACVTSLDATKGVAAQLGPGLSDPPPWWVGAVMIHPTHPSMDPVMPVGDGVRPRASLLQNSPLDSVYGEDLGAWSRSQSRSWLSSSSGSDRSNSRSRSRSWEREWDSRLPGASSSFGEAVKSLLASGMTASGSRIDPLVHPEEGGRDSGSQLLAPHDVPREVVQLRGGIPRPSTRDGPELPLCSHNHAQVLRTV